MEKFFIIVDIIGIILGTIGLINIFFFPPVSSIILAAEILVTILITYDTLKRRKNQK